MDSFSAVVAPTIVVAVCLWIWNRKTDGYPGPTPFPIIGNIPQVLAGSMDFDRKLQQFRQKFGEFFRLNLGQMTTIFVSGLRNIDDVLIQQGDNFRDRPSWLFVPDKIIKRKGLTWANGEPWKQIRSIVVKSQYNPSCAQHIETEIMYEIEELCRQLKPEEGKIMNPYNHFRLSAFQMLCIYIFGYCLDESDVTYLVDSILTLIPRNKSQALENMLPWLAYFMKSKHAAAMEKEAEVFDFITKKIDEHKEKFDPAHPKDLIDTYLLEMEKLSTEEQEDLHRNFLRTVIDLYIYGFEMNTSSLLWAVVKLAEYPDVQRKCQDEMEKIFPDSEKKITCLDREQLPYTSATLKEILRVVGPGVMTPPHTATEDATIVGHTVTRNELIVCDLTLPRFDENEWENPQEFSPERFIKTTEDLTDRPAYCVFGLGHRSCPVQKLARDMQYLVTVNLLRHFRISAQSDFSVDSHYKGISMMPKPFQVIFSLR